MTLYSNQSANIRTTWFIMTTFLLLVIGIGFILSYIYSSSAILYVAIAFSLITNIGAYWFSDKMVLSMAGARQISSKEEYPELWNTLENLCIAAGLPMPKLFIINDPAPNAFATGRNQDNAVIAVTTGLLPLLSKSELEGVLAHELGHIGNKDMLLQTVVVVFAGMLTIIANIALHVSSWGGEKKNPLFLILGLVAIVLAPLAATIIRLAISRQREYLADATGALITRYPEGLASALEKISNFHQPMKVQNQAIAHLYISNPTGVNHASELRDEEKIPFMQKIFMTHPPVKDRIAKLLVK
jgi:heat shock protein HtpX